MLFNYSVNMNLIVSIIFLVILNMCVGADPHQRSCETIKVNMCKNIGYNMTSMPNLARHTMQSDADITLQTFGPLLQYGCSQQLNLFLCSVYVPMCTNKLPIPIGPCRNLCENVYTDCFPVLNRFGFPWPLEFNCSRFPVENNDKTLCMEGPETSDIWDRGGASTKNRFNFQSSGTTSSLACRRFGKFSSYIYLNRSGRCVQMCDAEVLWESNERKLAEVWLTVWAALCFVGALIAVGAQLIIGDQCGKSLAMLALCHTLAAVGWGVRAAAGRSAVACTRDAQIPTRPLLTQDGLNNPNCAVVFIFLYYFGMAASAWWVVLCGIWRSRIIPKKHNPSGGNNAVSTISGVTASRSGACLQVAVWGIPAAQTLAVLVLRDVDADELTGICFVGNQSSRSLISLVIIPQMLYLIVGSVLLLSGVRHLCCPGLPQHCGLKERNDITTTQLGIFTVVYLVPLSCVVATWFYEFFNRDDWLAAITPTPVPVTPPKPMLWIFLLRILMLQILGIITSICILTSTASPAWKKICKVFVPPMYKTSAIKNPNQNIHYYSTTPIHGPLQRSHSHNKYPMHTHRKFHSHHTYPFPPPGGETVL